MKRLLVLIVFAAIAGVGFAQPPTGAQVPDGLLNPPHKNPSPYSAHVLKLNPAGYWRLGEPKGAVAFDWTSHRHNGSYHGKIGFGQRGAIFDDPDKAIRVDRKSYVEIPANRTFSVGANGLTVEVWMRPDALDFPGQTGSGANPYVHWLGKGETNQYEWGFRIYSRKRPDGSTSGRPNRISAYIWNASGGEGAGAYFEEPLTVGKWMHIVAVYEPASKPNAGVLIYRDGVFKKGPPDKGTLYSSYQITPTPGNAPVRLGTRDLGSFLVGGLDDVAIYPRVLKAAEIQRNYVLGNRGN